MDKKHKKLSTSTERGFTLIELLVVISMVAILATIAVPAISNSIQANRVSTENFHFIKAIKYARYQAIDGKQTITVSSNSGTADWSQGWIITDQNGTVLRNSIALGNGSVFTQNGNLNSFVFTRFGFLGNGVPLVFTHNHPNANCIGNYSGPITITPNGVTSTLPIVCDGNANQNS